MKIDRCATAATISLGLLLANFIGEAIEASAATSRAIWKHDNLLVWGLAPFDEIRRTPEERAELLEGLGLRRIAFNWREKDIPLFDEQIEAFKRHHIELVAWSIYDADDLQDKRRWQDRGVLSPDVLMGAHQADLKSPTLKELLEIFRRHDVHPQIWLVQPVRDLKLPERASQEAAVAAAARAVRADFPKSPQAQALRVSREAERVKALVQLAAPYGVEIELYNHNWWFGIMDNEVAVIEKLKKLGVHNVGIAYNVNHAHDDLHDDTVEFQAIWRRIKPYVVAVNFTATHAEGKALGYPSQGDRDLEIARVVQESGWRGPIGVLAENGGDAAVTLKNYLIGIDWLAAELIRPGSGGPRPFAPLH